MELPALETSFLFDMPLDVKPGPQDVGATPYGYRRIAEVTGGRFEGPRLKGRVLPGGGDWLLLRQDNVLQLDVRLTMETDDGVLIYMRYHGLRHGPEDVMARLNAGESVDPASYYFRTTPVFETGSERYAWLNRILCVATGHRVPNGPVYRVHQVL